MKKNVLLRLWRYIKGSRGFLVAALLSAAVSVALSLAGPLLVGEGVDLLIGAGQVDFASLARLTLQLAGLYVLAAAVTWLLGYFNNVVSYRTVRSLRTDAFHKLNRLPLSYIDHTAHGDTVARIVADAEAVSDGLLQGLTHLFTGVATIAGTLAFMLRLSPVVTLVVILITPLSIAVAALITRRSHALFREQSQTQGELSGYVSEMIGNQKQVRTFGYEQSAQRTFGEINERLRRCGFKAQVFSALVNPCTRFVNNGVYVAVGVVGALVSLASGRLSIGGLSAFLTYANQYTKPFNEISGVLAQIQTAFAAAQRLFHLLDEEEQLPDAEGLAPVRNIRGDVSFESVSFGYAPGRMLIRDLNLSVKAGQHVAIVGPTGAGKTTLVNLLMRFYELDSGTIRVDGRDIREMSRGGLRSLFGMVLQESWLLGGTIRENIAYGRPDASLDEVVQAAKAAHAHSFIKRLPQGYDTPVSESGANLSQGQRQLLCIARVMLCDPPLLILDEATSSIDTRTEQRIQKAFDEMTLGRTSFIVAHRLSTIREADIILVMQDGDIVEQGRHEELLQKGGFYAKLYNSQFVQNA